MKNLNISMSTCANQSLFGRNSSPQSPPECIPYKCLEQTAPSLIAGQLKSWKSAKSAKLDEKPQQLHEFLCDSQSVSMESKLSICSTIDPIQALWSSHSFLQRWSVKIPQLIKNSENKQKNLNNFMSSCPIQIIFDFLRTAWSALQFIPYTRLDQRTPS